MRYIFLAGIALFWSGLCGGSAEEPRDAGGPVARELAEIRKNYESEEKELKVKLDKAMSPEDRKQVLFLIKEQSALSANDAVELALKNPKDGAAVDAAVFALKLLGQFQVTGGDMDKASAFILDNHVDNPKIEVVLGPMSEAGDAGEKFLKTVAEKSTVKQVKGIASFYYGRVLGAEADSKKAHEEALEVLAKAVELAPEAKINDTTLAKAAAVEVASLKIAVGNPAPDVEGVDLDGKKVKLASMKGKVILFDFWATWCGPCRAMIPHERELAEKMAKKPFVLLSVNVDDEKSTLTDFLSEEKMPWSHWWDGVNGPLTKMFKIRAFPTIYLIDAKGVIRKKWLGSPGNEVLDKAVEELVAEAEKK